MKIFIKKEFSDTFYTKPQRTQRKILERFRIGFRNLQTFKKSI